MSTYFFDITMYGEHSIDMVGYSFGSPLLARMEANRIAAEILFDQPSDAAENHFMIRIVDGAGYVTGGFEVFCGLGTSHRSRHVA